MLNVQPAHALSSKIMTQEINPNPMFTFELNLEEANIVLAALQELPGKICNPLSEKIKAQAQAQIAAMQTAEQEATNQLLEQVNPVAE